MSKEISFLQELKQAVKSNNISEQEIARIEELMSLHYKYSMQQNKDKKEDQIRNMAWVSLWGMILYPFLIVVTAIFSSGSSAALITDIAPSYFISVAGLISVFFGAQAYQKSKNNLNDSSDF